MFAGELADILLPGQLPISGYRGMHVADAGTS